MRHKHCLTWNMEKNTQKCGKREMHAVGPGKWQETVKNVKNEKCTPQDLDYGEKTEKRGKLDQHIV